MAVRSASAAFWPSISAHASASRASAAGRPRTSDHVKTITTSSGAKFHSEFLGAATTL
jgi:outer membrane protein TolC